MIYDHQQGIYMNEIQKKEVIPRPAAQTTASNKFPQLMFDEFIAVDHYHTE